MPLIRTVLGDIDPKDFGVCDCHEHLIRTGGAELSLAPDFLLDDIGTAEAEFRSWTDSGGASMVCMDPIGCGRDVPRMMELANRLRGRGHIVMATGFHKGEFYDQRSHWLATAPVDAAVDAVAREIEEGMDLYSLSGPIVRRVPAKAGVVKAGAGFMAISEFERKALQVAAEVHLRTGCPISVHTQGGTLGPEILEALKGCGADESRVILCHLQKNPDIYEWRRVLDRGAWVCLDGPARPQHNPDSLLAENIRRLTDWGYADRLLLAMDAGRGRYQKAYMESRGSWGVRGIAWLLTGFVPLLREVGVGQGDIDAMLVDNPARAFAFRQEARA